jgi:hypothetical protein
MSINRRRIGRSGVLAPVASPVLISPLSIDLVVAPS